ncbi:MAG TPA: hypothetical protein ENG51_10455 [Deltaproteobacteria bacterium]|nr:hypothetical protein [Deltaproteobacteria bacterium]
MPRLQKMIRKLVLLLVVGFTVYGCAHGPKIKSLPEQDITIEHITKDKEKQEAIKKLIIRKAEEIASKRMAELAREKQLKQKEIEKEQHRVLKQILKSPPVPIKVPDTILRVLILPYVDANGVFHQYSYLYLKVDEGKWLLGDYLLGPIKTTLMESSAKQRKRKKKLATPLR